MELAKLRAVKVGDKRKLTEISKKQRTILEIPILLVICLLASAVPVYGAPLLTQWDVEDQAGGIAVGPEGEVNVNINQNHKVVKYSPEGEMLDEWTVDGVVTGIAVGPDGLVYLSFTHGLIQVFAA